MIDFKACPRDKGDLILENDMYGEYKRCLQCGHYIDILEKVSGNGVNNPSNGNGTLDELAYSNSKSTANTKSTDEANGYRTIDKFIQGLDYIDGSRGPVTATYFSSRSGISRNSAISIFEIMERGGYVKLVTKSEEAEPNTYENSSDGNIVRQDYWKLIDDVEENGIPTKDGSITQPSTYELIKLNSGKLTTLGKYTQSELIKDKHPKLAAFVKHIS